MFCITLPCRLSKDPTQRPSALAPFWFSLWHSPLCWLFLLELSGMKFWRQRRRIVRFLSFFSETFSFSLTPRSEESFRFAADNSPMSVVFFVTIADETSAEVKVMRYKYGSSRRDTRRLSAEDSVIIGVLESSVSFDWSTPEMAQSLWH